MSRLQKYNKTILIPPPPEDSVRIKELQVISGQYLNRYNPEIIQDILDSTVLTFNTVVKRHALESHEYLIEELILEIKPIILNHKNYFNSERPHELAINNNISFKHDFLESAQTPSYPSGHTTQAYYVAYNLSDLYPELRKEFMEVANMISQARVDRGVHFPSDILAGKLLADKLIKLSNKDFLREFINKHLLAHQ